jgi:hypothetical protein
MIGPAFVGVAFAQSILPCEHVNTFEASFKAEDAETRRASRDASAKLGPYIVKPLMAMYNANRNNYRVVLGVTVALSKMLDENRMHRILVDESLTQENINEFIKLSIHSDRTLRSYAGTFMYDVGSPRAIGPLLETSRQIERTDFPDKNAAFNMVLIASNTYAFADRTAKQTLSQFFTRWTGRVSTEADALIAKLR